MMVLRSNMDSTRRPFIPEADQLRVVQDSLTKFSISDGVGVGAAVVSADIVPLSCC